VLKVFVRFAASGIGLDSRSALRVLYGLGLLGVDVCMKQPQWLQLMHPTRPHKPGAIVGTAVGTLSCDPEHEVDLKAAEKNSRNQIILHTTIQPMALMYA
jgi:hypothetical protein